MEEQHKQQEREELIVAYKHQPNSCIIHREQAIMSTISNNKSTKNKINKEAAPQEQIYGEYYFKKNRIKIHSLNLNSELRSLRQSTILALKDSEYTHGKLTITCSKQKQATEAINEKIQVAQSRVSMLTKELRDKRGRNEERNNKMTKQKRAGGNFIITFPNIFEGFSRKRTNTNTNTNTVVTNGGEKCSKISSSVRQVKSEQTLDTFLLDQSNHSCPSLILDDCTYDDSEELNTTRHDRDPLRVDCCSCRISHGALEEEDRIEIPVKSPDNDHKDLLVDFCTSKEKRRRRSHVLLQDLETEIAAKDSMILELERHLVELLDRLQTKSADQRPTTARTTSVI